MVWNVQRSMTLFWCFLLLTLNIIRTCIVFSLNFEHSLSVTWSRFLFAVVGCCLYKAVGRLTWIRYFSSCAYIRKIINIHTAKFCETNCPFSRYNDKNTPSLNKLNNPVLLGQTGKNCLHGEKLSHLSDISPAFRWDLTWKECIHSYINGLF